MIRSGPRERLTFNLGLGTVSGKGLIDSILANSPVTTFATALKAEPRDWGYFGLLAFTAVLLTRPQDQVPGLTVFHLAEICAILGIAPMLLHRFARRLPVFRVTRETVGLVVLGGALLMSVPFSIWPSGALGVFTDSYLKVLVVFFLMMNTLTTPKRLDQITWLIVVCCGYIAAHSIFNYVRGIHLVEGDRLGGAVGGIFGNPNDLAMNMVTFLPVAAVVAMTKEYPATRRLAAAGIAALMLATIVFTKSRGGLVGLVAMLLVLVFLGRRVRRGFGIMTIAAVVAATPFMPASFWNRMASITDEQKDAQEYTGSREARRVVMIEGIHTFLQYPLTGIGAGQFQNYNPPERKERWLETHNALIQVAAETGALGLAAFSFLIGCAAVAAASMRKMLTPPRRRNAPDPAAVAFDPRERRFLYAHSVAMTAGLAGWFVCSMFASVAYSWTFYYVLALIVAGRELVRDRIGAVRAVETARSANTVSPHRRHPARRVLAMHTR